MRKSINIQIYMEDKTKALKQFILVLVIVVVIILVVLKLFITDFYF